MGNAITEDCLRICFRDPKFSGMNEVPGILVYGYWPEGRADCPSFPRYIWPPPNDHTNFKLFSINGAPWVVWMWNVSIPQWPSVSMWTKQIRDTLNIMIAEGAIVGWCGLEGLFADPPALFDPKEMSGGVWAYLTSKDEFVCKANLEQHFDVLSDNEMAALRRKVGL